jgi:hypothetical protein
MLFRRGGKLPRCYVCLRTWRVIESVRIRKSVYLQVYECQWCAVTVTVGETVMHAESKRDDREQALRWMLRAMEVVLGRGRAEIRRGTG